MKQQGSSWLLETGKLICIDRTTMFPVVDMSVSTCYTKLLTAMMTEQCCNNIVITELFNRSVPCSNSSAFFNTKIQLFIYRRHDRPSIRI